MNAFRFAHLPLPAVAIGLGLLSIHSSAQVSIPIYAVADHSPVDSGAAGPLLPDAPFAAPVSDFADPAPIGQRNAEPWEGVRHYGPFSRVSIGADVNPLGIGIKGTTILTEYLDARLLVNFFNFNSGDFDVDTIRANNAELHMFSVGAAVDVYPHNSIWRLSGGLLMYNGNNVSMTANIRAGESVTVNGQNFYSANSNSATGATPLGGSGSLGLNGREPELFLSGGFGRFVPRSERHWSFPAEFGVVFMGAPTINLTTSGWVCTGPKDLNCSNVADPANPVAQQFNTALQTEEAKWRRSLQSFTIYPMFSYSVVYSFDLK